ncbi:MAG: DUF5591 domain-containing protein [Candidatus Thorarchaeota archaeon]
MTRFLIGRGHDGPARVGKFTSGEINVNAPLLVGPVDQSGTDLRYVKLDYKPKPHDPPLIYPLTIMSSENLVPPENSRAIDSFLLPSIIGAPSLGSQVTDTLLELQLEALNDLKSEIEPSRMILRLPRFTNIEKLPEILAKFASAGLRMASLLFNGQLGPFDFNAVSNRSVLPRNWMFMATGRIRPSMIPVLYYLGFDTFDIGHALEAAAKKVRLWRMGSELIRKSHGSRHCTCSGCSAVDSLSEASGEVLRDVLIRHNIDVYRSILSESQHGMKQGKLRWLVESYTHSSPSAAGFLRRIDKDLYDYIEEFTRTTGNETIPLVGPESYYAPSIRRFREYVASRHSPPSHKKIVLLLPCSARKPYSDSRSHKRFGDAIDSALGSARAQIAEVILTSPLGVIPRELERMYPAANYDIPVTGSWDAEETEIAVKALLEYLTKHDESTVVVAHVSGGYLEIVRNAEPKIEQSLIYTTHDSHATSQDALQSLRDVMTDMKEMRGLEHGSPTFLKDTVRATADFQFGVGAGVALVPDDAKLTGKVYRMIVCRVDKEQTCAFVASSGTLSLTLDGARRLEPLRQYWVKFNGEQVEGGSLFAVGITEADSKIRPGDEVIIINQHDDVVAVGRSEMSGLEMCEFNKGRAVSLRHKLE